jgi:membrane protease YdiL (CAAX protease family)
MALNKKGQGTKIFLAVFLAAFWLIFPMVLSFMGFNSGPDLNGVSKLQNSDPKAMDNPLYLLDLLKFYAQVIFSIWLPEFGVLGNLIKILAQLMTVIVLYLLIRGD